MGTRGEKAYNGSVVLILDHMKEEKEKGIGEIISVDKTLIS